MRRSTFTAALVLMVGATQTTVSADISYLLTEHEDGIEPEITVISVRAADGHAAPWLEQAIMADTSTRARMVEHARNGAVSELRAA